MSETEKSQSDKKSNTTATEDSIHLYENDESFQGKTKNNRTGSSISEVVSAILPTKGVHFNPKVLKRIITRHTSSTTVEARSDNEDEPEIIDIVDRKKTSSDIYAKVDMKQEGKYLKHWAKFNPSIFAFLPGCAGFVFMMVALGLPEWTIGTGTYGTSNNYTVSIGSKKFYFIHLHIYFPITRK